MIDSFANLPALFEISQLDFDLSLVTLGILLLGSYSQIRSRKQPQKENRPSEIRETPSSERGEQGISLRSEPVEEPSTQLSTSEITAPQPIDPLSIRLSKSRRGLFDVFRSVFSGKPKIDTETLEELEMLLISSDLGVKTVSKLLDELRMAVRDGLEVSETELLKRLRELLLQGLQGSGGALNPASTAVKPYVVMVVGVNGVGKTTSIGKLASHLKGKGYSVMLAAADTFRAAAVDQLEQWGKRLDVAVVRGADEAKPATVVFDAMERAKAGKVDVLIIDTAGRLHTKTSLMQELSGVRNIIARHEPSAPHEVLLVVDGTTGQNALSQAKEFHNATQLTGLVVTKLDGTAKGGIVVAIQNELGIPVRYIGVGEGLDDLREFSAAEFVDALLDEQRASEVVSEHGGRRRKRREG